MYTVTVEAGFHATHRVRLPDGSLERSHAHTWSVTAVFRAKELDALGMVVDFHEVERVLGRVVGQLHDTDLSDHPSLGGDQATAERIARWIFDSVAIQGVGRLARIDVTEAPGCVASYEADAPPLLQNPTPN